MLDHLYGQLKQQKVVEIESLMVANDYLIQINPMFLYVSPHVH